MPLQRTPLSPLRGLLQTDPNKPKPGLIVPLRRRPEGRVPIDDSLGLQGLIGESDLDTIATEVTAPMLTRRFLENSIGLLESTQTGDPTPEETMALTGLIGVGRAVPGAVGSLVGGSGLTSKALVEAQRLKQAKGSAQQMEAQLLKAGVKPDEIKFSGLRGLLDETPTVTREQIVAHLEGNPVNIEKTVLRSTPAEEVAYYENKNSELVRQIEQLQRDVAAKYGDDIPPGVSQHIEELEADLRTSLDEFDKLIENQPKYGQYALPGGENYREILWHKPPDAGDEVSGGTSNPFRSSHFSDQPNLIAHARVKDRATPSGEKVLFIEELQSDFAQAARKGEDAATGLLGKVPFVDSTKKWVDFSLKSLIKEAVDNGYDRVAWAPGQTHVDRYSLATKLDKIEFAEGTGGTYLHVLDKNGRQPMGIPDKVSKEELPGIIGKELADKLLKAKVSSNPQAASRVHYKAVVKEGQDFLKKHNVPSQGGGAALHSTLNDFYLTAKDEATRREAFDLFMKLQDARAADVDTGVMIRAGLLGEDVVGDPTFGEVYRLEGDGLQIGGEGMKSFYDKIIPNAAQKLIKKLDKDAKVERTRVDINSGDYSVEPHFSGRSWNIRRNGEVVGPDYPTQDAAEEAVSRLSLPETLSIPITPKMREAVKQDGLSLFSAAQKPGTGSAVTAAAQNFSDAHPGRISTRLPTAKAASEDPVLEPLSIGFQESAVQPEVFKHNVEQISKYPNMPKSQVTGKAAQDAETFIEHAKDNLLWIHDQIPEAIRSRSSLWYDGARKIADNWSDKYQIPDTSIAGVLAALSPQKDWFQNVSLAERVLDIMLTKNNEPWSAAMEARMGEVFGTSKHRYLRDLIRGKTLSELDDPKAKAMWLRVYDEVHHDRGHRLVTPEGTFGDLVTKKDGTPKGTGWNSLVEISKAIQSVESGGDKRVLTDLMGTKHKIRNFFNNILDPNGSHGDVTIDTHAVAANLLRPLAGKSREVHHNFGSSPKKAEQPRNWVAVKNSSKTGVQGTYGLHAEAYRRAAAERGILPRQMQSITWEAVRGLFPDTFKTQAKNVKAVDDIWEQYRNGKITIEDARKKVLEKAGGFEPPAWFRGGANAPVHGQGADTSYLGKLSGADLLRGENPGGSGRRGAGGNPGGATEGLLSQKIAARGIL